MSDPVLKTLEGSSRTIELSSGGIVVISKWPLAKLLQMWTLAQGAYTTTGGTLLERLGSRLETVVLESVRLEDQAKVKTMDADDMLEVATAALELNVTPRVVKNVKALFALSRQARGGSAVPTP